MGDFVSHENTRGRADGTYSEVIKRIKEDGVCPFCPENLPTYHKNPVITAGSHWLLTKNMYPYEGTKHHILIIHKQHVESLTAITAEAWEELRTMVTDFIKQERILGGAFYIRFGDPAHTGASVRHLHANLVSPPSDNKDRPPVIVRVG